MRLKDNEAYKIGQNLHTSDGKYEGYSQLNMNDHNISPRLLNPSEETP